MRSGGARRGLPDAVVFATTPKPGRTLFGRALAVGVPAAWVTADRIYGDDDALRQWLESRPLGVVAVTRTQRAPLGLDTVQERAGATFAAGDGAKGPRRYDWAYQGYPSLPP